MKNTTAIEVRGLQKSFGKLQVLKDINFKVPEGQILALLGPNGAGKTTTINILSTLMQPDEGAALIAGHDVVHEGDAVRASIGLTGQFAAVDEYLTGRENIKMIGRLYHLDKETIDKQVDELLHKFDLVDAADRPARTYSGGMKRRLDLAMSLVASPPVLFLDEPTTGLDPRSRLALWQMIKQLAKEGTTILLTTQYMEEAEYLSDNVIVIDHGTVIAEGTVNQLKARAGSEQVVLTLKKKADIPRAKRILPSSKIMQDDGDTLVIASKHGVKDLKDAIEQLEKEKISLDSAALRRPTLDDVFLALTGHAATEKEAK